MSTDMHLQVQSLADFFQDETIFVAYGPERYYADDFDLDENGELKHWLLAVSTRDVHLFKLFI